MPDHFCINLTCVTSVTTCLSIPIDAIGFIVSFLVIDSLCKLDSLRHIQQMEMPTWLCSAASLSPN